MPLFLNICVYIIYIIAIVITLLFLNLTYSVCKGKGLRYYISFHLDLFSLLPLGVKIIIFIRLFFIFFCISDFIMSNIAIEYSLCMLPNHGDFSQILGPTVAGPGQNGSNLPPTGGGSNLPPTGGTALGITNNPSGPSILHKVELQGTERHGLKPISIYSTTSFTPAATLSTAERYHLGILVGDDENNGTSGVYNTIIRKSNQNLDQFELRVVINRGNKPLSGYLSDVQSSADFRQYLRKFP